MCESHPKLKERKKHSPSQIPFWPTSSPVCQFCVFVCFLTSWVGIDSVHHTLQHPFPLYNWFFSFCTVSCHVWTVSHIQLTSFRCFVPSVSVLFFINPDFFCFFKFLLRYSPWSTRWVHTLSIGKYTGKTGLLPGLLTGIQGWKCPVVLSQTCCGSKSPKVILID